jgi:hypothetical protein
MARSTALQSPLVLSENTYVGITKNDGGVVFTAADFIVTELPSMVPVASLVFELSEYAYNFSAILFSFALSSDDALYSGKHKTGF